jgi:hypothetical protein
MDIDESSLFDIFNYRTQTNEEKEYIKLDYSCIMYNQIYKSHEFYESKFPTGFENMIGFDKIIDKIVEQSLDNNPIKEYNERINIYE